MINDLSLSEVILRELERARDGNDAMNGTLYALMEKVTEMAGGVRVMEEKISNIAATMAHDRTLTANQIQVIRDDVAVLMSHRNEMQSLKQRGWGIVFGLMLAAATAGAGLKAVFAELFG
jgi:hypothetical protein